MITDIKEHEIRVGLDVPIAGVSFHSICAAPRSSWMFLKLALANGSAGWGELTLRSHASVMQQVIDGIRPSLIGKTLDETLVFRKAWPGMPSGRAGNAVISALDQAATDLAGQHLSRPIASLWGAPAQNRLASYATVNRSVANRTPQGFADACSAAVAAGFQGVKIMPLEKVMPASAGLREGQLEIEQALERLRAVREAIGDEVRLMADLHWRLDEASASEFLVRATPLKLHWLECPMPESSEWFGAIRRVRKLANDANVLLAGGENLVGLAGALPFIDQELYDVLMPDIKYCGGYGEFSRINARAKAGGVSISPHNPSGPIAHAHTVHVCSALGITSAIEQQFAESPLFERSVIGAKAGFELGFFSASQVPGLGVSFDETLEAAFPPQPAPMSFSDPSFA